MAVKVLKHAEAGHPWDGRPGFDHLELQADTTEELKTAVADAEKKFWQSWLIGTNEDGIPGGIMFKPCGITTDWHDSPKKRHPGIIEKPRSGISLGM